LAVAVELFQLRGGGHALGPPDAASVS
jgi:hypothetical protein